VSRRARRHIQAHGGRLFVWFKRIDSLWVVQKVSTKAPAGFKFLEHPDGDITVHLQTGFDPPPVLKIRLHPWWPIQPIAVSSGLHGDIEVPPDSPRSWPTMVSLASHQGGGHGGHHAGGHGGHHGS
jgi:hypothetical protein